MRKQQFIPLETHLFNALFPQDLLIAACGTACFLLQPWFRNLLHWLVRCSAFLFLGLGNFFLCFFPSDIFPISHIVLFVLLLSMKFKLI